MKSILIFFALLTAFALPAQVLEIGSYKLTKAKIVGIGIASVGGLADGMVEGYEFDGRTSFERKWGKSARGYWGSESWRVVYKGGEPANGFKSPAHNAFGAWDFYHNADDLRKLGYISGGIVIGIGGNKVNTEWWHYAIDFGLTFAVSSVTKKAGMYYIRN